jgi:hypothetical protein
MSVGSILVAIALALVVGAWLARPFHRSEPGLKRSIEAWVAQVRAEGMERGGAGASPGGEVEYCTRCGRRAGPGDRFCASCGTWLREAAE